MATGAKDWRNSREYRIWRVGVIRRDKRCVLCNTLEGREAHHINHATYFPDERFLLGNGVTLCKACHTQFHTNYKKSFREKCNRDDFMNFLVLARYYISINEEDVDERARV